MDHFYKLNIKIMVIPNQGNEYDGSKKINLLIFWYVNTHYYWLN
jgi:hypothetical protein